MNGSRTAGAAIVVGALCVAALVWFVSYDEPRAERAGDEPKSERVGESTQLAASELAQTTTVDGVRMAVPAVDLVDASDATAALAEAPQLVVTRAGAPLVGAYVVVWNESGREFEFTSDENGRIELPADLREDGPWFALAGGDGACSSALEPVFVDPTQPVTDLPCTFACHLALEIERSDGLPSGDWPDIRRTHVRHNDDGLVFDVDPPTRQQFAVLLAAGLAAGCREADIHIVVPTWKRWDGAGRCLLVDCFEPDTERKFWVATARPLDAGGTFERVELEVREGVGRGVVEISVGCDDASLLAGLQSIEVRFASMDDVRGLESIEAVVRSPRQRDRPTCLRTPIPSGRYRADLDLGFGRATEHLFASMEVDVTAGGSVSIEFDASGLGWVGLPDSFDDAPCSSAEARTLHFADLRSRASFDLDRAAWHGDRVVVPPGDYLVCVGELGGWLTPERGRAAPVLDELTGIMLFVAHDRCSLEARPTPMDLSEWIVEVQPRATTKCAFVRTAPAEEGR